MANKSKKILAGITETNLAYTFENSLHYKKLVYFEKYTDKTKALRRKRLFMKLNKKQIDNLITKKNPEWLNLIFAVYGEENFSEQLR